MKPALGLVQWFQFGDGDSVRRAARELLSLGVNRLRVGVSWADFVRGTATDAEGQRWYTWLFTELGAFDVLPTLAYTPPTWSRNGHSNGAPQRLADFADWTGQMIDLYGRDWTHVQLWHEPNGWPYWDRGVDPFWALFAEMVEQAALVVRARGKRVVFPGCSPNDPAVYEIMASHGVLTPDLFDVVGIHGFPGTWEDDPHDTERPRWRGWDEEIRSTRTFGIDVWLTEVGYSHHERSGMEQVAAFRETLAAADRNNIERVYWYSLFDLPTHVESTSLANLGRWNSHEYAMGLTPQLRRVIRDYTAAS